jgi:hypothetical protein
MTSIDSKNQTPFSTIAGEKEGDLHPHFPIDINHLQDVPLWE